MTSLKPIDLSGVRVLPPAPRGPRRPLLTPIPDAPDEYLLVVDNSALEKFTTCPMSAYYYMVAGREAHARNAALTFGGAIHVGMERLELGASPEAQDAAVRQFFLDNPAPPDEYRSAATAVEVMAHYRKRATFPDYAWEIQSDAHGPLVERAFELPLGVVDVNARICTDRFDSFVKRIHIAWSGRIDLIARCNNRVRIGDHKTTSIAGDQVIQDFQLASGTLGYVWSGRRLWPDLDITGVVINFIHLKRPAKGLGLADKGPRGGDPALNFFRSYYDYTPERIAWWEHNTLLIVTNFIQALVHNEFSFNTKWCFGKYGRCPYHDVCIQDDSAIRRSMLMSDMYRDVTWNPTADR